VPSLSSLCLYGGLCAGKFYHRHSAAEPQPIVILLCVSLRISALRRLLTQRTQRYAGDRRENFVKKAKTSDLVTQRTQRRNRDLVLPGCKFAFFSQRIKIVSFFRQQTFGHQLLNDIEHSRSGFGIIAAGLEQLVQVEGLLLPVCKTSQYFSCEFIHGSPNRPFRRLLLAVDSSWPSLL